MHRNPNTHSDNIMNVRCYLRGRPPPRIWKCIRSSWSGGLCKNKKWTNYNPRPVG